MLHKKKYYPYSTQLGINVLYLNRIDMATEEDVKNGLDYWTRLFKSDSWEELQALAEKNPIGEEVAEVMYEAMIQSEEKTIFEGHQRFLYEMAAAREDAAWAKKTMEEAEIMVAEANKRLANKEIEIASKDREIARLNALLEKNGINYDIGHIS